MNITRLDDENKISFPLNRHRAESICNLVFTIYSRGKLMSKATGGDFYASEALVDDLQNGVGNNDKNKVLTVIKNVADELRGISFEYDKNLDGNVIFNGFPNTDDEALIRAWYSLAEAINKTAIKQRHIRAKRSDEPNEKFAFRTWLTRLGLNGADLKEERSILYKNLNGHTAFRNEETRQKWTARQKEKQEALREQKELAIKSNSAD